MKAFTHATSSKSEKDVLKIEILIFYPADIQTSTDPSSQHQPYMCYRFLLLGDS